MKNRIIRSILMLSIALSSIMVSGANQDKHADSIILSSDNIAYTHQPPIKFSERHYTLISFFALTFIIGVVILILFDIRNSKKYYSDTTANIQDTDPIEPDPIIKSQPVTTRSNNTQAPKPLAESPEAAIPTKSIEAVLSKQELTQELKQPRQKIIIKPISEALTDLAKDEKIVEISICTVNYDAQQLESTNNSYAIVKAPRNGCVIRSYREGHRKIRGYKETNFYNTLHEFFGRKFIVSNSVRLNTGEYTRPYEPDIAVIDKTSGINLRIDIEIDEPYSGVSRKPTHCIGEDDARDCYFTDRGWMVIRFTEYQVHLSELSCVKLIAKIIQSIYANFSIPEALDSVDDLKIQPKWDVLQAQKWAGEYYRENYLNHKFKEVEQVAETVERALNNAEQEEERLVKPFAHLIIDNTEALGYNKVNIQQRDERIKFYPKPHIYTIDGVPADSVTTIVSKFFPVFDAQYWAYNLGPNNELYGIEPERVLEIWEQESIESSVYGAMLHKHIEEYYLSGKIEQTDEFNLFMQFVKNHAHLKPYRTEWRIFEEDYSVAGTIDLIVKEGSHYNIYDWKRSKKLIGEHGAILKDNKYMNTGLGVLCNTQDSNYWHYCLQQNIYKYILIKRYQITVNKMYLIVLHPKYSKYYKIEVPDMRDEVRAIFTTL